MFEINLVPDIKAEVLKTQRIRNIIFIVCVMVMIGFGVVLMSLTSFKLVQDSEIGEKQERLKTMSSKVGEFDSLNDLLTIQGQLNSIDELAKGRIEYSRFFDLMNTLPPKAKEKKTDDGDEEVEEEKVDEITFSKVVVDVKENTITFDAIANAKTEPLIDYRVLEAFKKSMGFMKFDYGVYKNKNGFTIPSICIIETDEDGNILEDEENNSIYAIWTKGVDGCDPEDEGKKVKDEDGEEILEKTEVVNILEEDVLEARDSDDSVKIWRTPQLKEWYKSSKKYINDVGEISNIEHFESNCIKYEVVNGRWNKTNSCDLIVGELEISSSSNGRDESYNLVLNFSAKLKYNPEALLAKNKHMNFIGPNEFVNVTDSNLQIKEIFKEKAEDCYEGDYGCIEGKEEE